VEALRKNERQDETQEPSKLMVFWVSPLLNANVLFLQVLVWPNSGVLVLSFPDFTDALIFCKFYMKLDISLILCIFLRLSVVIDAEP
jgi:hypothetical protein